MLIGAFDGEARNPVVAEIEEAVSTLRDPIDVGFVREFQVSTLAQPVPPAFLETVVQESLKLPAWVWREVFAGLREDDAAAELGKISAPTLVISGDRDGFAVPDVLEARIQDVAGARLVVYHGAGHALHWEEPARFAADLAAFAHTLKSRG